MCPSLFLAKSFHAKFHALQRVGKPSCQFIWISVYKTQKERHWVLNLFIIYITHFLMTGSVSHSHTNPWAFFHYWFLHYSFVLVWTGSIWKMLTESIFISGHLKFQIQLLAVMLLRSQYKHLHELWPFICQNLFFSVLSLSWYQIHRAKSCRLCREYDKIRCSWSC